MSYCTRLPLITSLSRHNWHSQLGTVKVTLNNKKLDTTFALGITQLQVTGNSAIVGKLLLVTSNCNWWLNNRMLLFFTTRECNVKNTAPLLASWDVDIRGANDKLFYQQKTFLKKTDKSFLYLLVGTEFLETVSYYNSHGSF